MQRNDLSHEQVRNFIIATGGGKGSFYEDEKAEIFNQSERCQNPKLPSGLIGQIGLGFGRIRFKEDPDPKPFIRVPWHSSDRNYSTDQRLLLHFVESVWGLPRPKLLVSITGGATDSLQNSDDLQLVLSDLVSFARRTSAWLTTGGTHAGIMKLVGQARYRFGAKIPLLALVPWGPIRGNSDLQIMEGKFNTGYLTSLPVHYKPDEPPLFKESTMTAALDPNHTHFILVDDGKPGFGSEITLRGLFEAGSVGSASIQNVEQLTSVEKGKDKFWGWEGAVRSQYGGTEEAADDLGLVICLCFEGGPGTIGTVKGTGRAADLIADALDIYEEELCRRGGEDSDAPDVHVMHRDQGREDKRSVLESMQRAVLVRRFLLLLGDLQNVQLQPENRKPRRDRKPVRTMTPRYTTADKTWYPAVSGLDEAMKDKVKAAFKWSYRGQGAGWDIRITEGDSMERRLQPGSQEFLVWTVRVGFQMFEAYDVKFDTAAKVMTAMCNLFDVVVSKRCMSFPLGSRRRGADGRWELARVDEAILKCIVKCKLLRNTELEHLGSFLGKWRDFVKRESQTQEHITAAESSTSVVGSTVSGGAGLDGRAQERTKFIEFCSKCADECSARNQALMSRTLLLLVQWDQPSLVVAMLRDISEQSIGLLHEALRLAIVHDNAMIAASALQLGANTAAYNLSAQKKDSAVKIMPWKEFLIGASDDEEEQYLATLITKASKVLKENHENEAQNKIGDTDDERLEIQDAKQIKNDGHAVEILDRICALVVTNASEALDKEDVKDASKVRKELENLSFLYDRNGVWAGADFGLLFAMLLVNREGLVHLFFAREGRRDAASLMPNALWACLVCRKLSEHEDVGKYSYHLKNGFEVTCNKYEELATSILKMAGDRSEECALLALERPLQCCAKWTPMDLIIMAKCDKVIEQCSDLCISVIQNRFYGGSGGWVRLAVNKALKVLPSAAAVLSSDENEDRPGFSSASQFSGDVAAHVFLSSLMMTLLLNLFSPVVTFLVECIVILLLLGDEVPDILFEGIPVMKSGESIRTAFMKGFLIYVKDNGEVAELTGSTLFIIGFIARYLGLGILLSLAGLREVDIPLLLYGMATGVMWLRTLSFVLVQQDLGQFVRVLMNMAKDLGFFSIAWFMLILAFSAMMLGADPKGLAEEAESAAADDVCPSAEGDEGPPMQSWGMWWFIRTYLQSLGQDYLDEMKSGASNAIFLVMWPIFNVLLVNLLVAVMGDRYDAAKERATVDFCYELYKLDQDYRNKGRSNAISLAIDVYCWLQRRHEGKSTTEHKEKNSLVDKIAAFLEFRAQGRKLVADGESGEDAMQITLETLQREETDAKKIEDFKKELRHMAERIRKHQEEAVKVKDHMTQCSFEALALWEAMYPPPQPAPSPSTDDPSLDAAAGLAALELEVARLRTTIARSRKTE